MLGEKNTAGQFTGLKRTAMLTMLQERKRIKIMGITTRKVDRNPSASTN